MSSQDLVSYYKDRAKEYEQIYLKPERQHDLQQAAAILQSLFARRTVLEIACGTGYWTEKIAATASSVHATDINQSVLDIAAGKPRQNNVTFELADMYSFTPGKPYDALFGGFIWSHVLLQDLDTFISRVCDLVVPGGMIVFMDNHYVAGSNHPITGTDEQGNTYQTRKLENGTSHVVLKNFPTREFMVNKLSGVAAALNYTSLPYYWITGFQKKAHNHSHTTLTTER